jgi:hypothetical protein
MQEQALGRGLMERFLKLISVFKEASHDFIFHFLHNKAAKHFEDQRRIYTKN